MCWCSGFLHLCLSLPWEGFWILGLVFIRLSSFFLNSITLALWLLSSIFHMILRLYYFWCNNMVRVFCLWMQSLTFKSFIHLNLFFLSIVLLMWALIFSKLFLIPYFWWLCKWFRVCSWVFLIYLSLISIICGLLKLFFIWFSQLIHLLTIGIACQFFISHLVSLFNLHVSSSTLVFLFSSFLWSHFIVVMVIMQLRSSLNTFRILIKFLYISFHLLYFCELMYNFSLSIWGLSLFFVNTMSSTLFVVAILKWSCFGGVFIILVLFILSWFSHSLSTIGCTIWIFRTILAFKSNLFSS